MNWQVAFDDDIREKFAFGESSDFRLRVIEYVLARLENDTCTSLGVRLIQAPIRGCIWFFNMPDQAGDYWRFRVFFNDTAKPHMRIIYDFSARKLDI